MTFRPRALALAAAALSTLTACGGKLIAEQPFAVASDKVTLAWETTVPEGEASLWLDYDLQTGSETDIGHRELDPVYDLAGIMRVTTGANPVYDGHLRLSSDDPPTTQLTSKVTIGSRQSCNTKGCSISGRVRALSLDTLAAGSTIVISAALPLEGRQIRVEALSMQLRAK